MNDSSWEKNRNAALKPNKGRRKFFIGGLLMLAAVAYLIVGGTMSGAQYYKSIEELVSNPDYAGQEIRISGAVIGDTIQYDPENLIIEFTVAHIPDQYDDLAVALHESVNNPDTARLSIVVEGEAKPDLLQHEAQAIMTGVLDENGTFHANELLLKCPSRFQDTMPSNRTDMNL